MVVAPAAGMPASPKLAARTRTGMAARINFLCNTGPPTLPVRRALTADGRGLAVTAVLTSPIAATRQHHVHVAALNRPVWTCRKAAKEIKPLYSPEVKVEHSQFRHAAPRVAPARPPVTVASQGQSGSSSLDDTGGHHQRS